MVRGGGQALLLPLPLRPGMPPYHCTLPVEGVPRACGCALLAVADRPGDAPPPEGGELDILDQAIRFFRANVLFKRFDVRGEGDRTLLYLTFYLSLCMNRLEKARTRAEGERAMAELARESFAAPGDSKWILGAFFPTAASQGEADEWKGYMKSCRERVGRRLLHYCYKADGSYDKFWMSFCNKKFMGKALT